MKLSALLLLLSSVSVLSSVSIISGDIEDNTVCGTSFIESLCAFEADPDRRRRIRERRRLARAAGRILKDDSDDEADGFINKCTVFVNGTEVNVTIKDSVYTIVTYDEDVKGDDTELELFQSSVKVFNTTIAGTYKLETFTYDDPKSDKKEDTITTLKTFSVAWSGC